jgi:hypothetical protein
MEKFNLFYNASYLDFLLFLALIFFFMLVLAYIKLKIKLTTNITFFLFFYHNLFFLIYTYYQIEIGTDAVSYFLNYEGYERNDISTGRVFLHKLIGYFSALNINIHNINYIFSALSFLPFLFFLKIIQELKVYENSKINYYLLISFLFLPSLHFWISGYSKDTISFIAIFFISYLYITRVDRQLPQVSNKLFIILLFSLIILLYSIRPHLALLMTTSSAIYYFCSKKYSVFNYKFILTLGLGLPIIYFLFTEVFGNTLNYENITRIINMYRNLDEPNTGSQINLDKKYYVFKFILYLFAPNILFIQSLNLQNIIVIIENTFLIFFFLKLFKFRFCNIKSVLFNLIMLILFFAAMTLITSNLGISNRQKWMAFLPLVITFLYVRYFNEKNLNFSKQIAIKKNS